MNRFLLLPLSGLLALLSGCGLGTKTSSAHVTSTLGPIQGNVHGGQQPVVGAHVYLYATGATGNGGKDMAPNSGDASVSLLTSTGSNVSFDGTNYYVSTGDDGGFSISGDYTCTSGSQLYLYVVGGNPGTGPNSHASFLSGLGACPAGASTLLANAFFWVNEVTTVATAYALAGYAADAQHIAANTTGGGAAAQLAATGIANAMANVSNLVDISTGNALAITPAGNGLVPQAEINTLANILAACINSSDAASDNCTALFNAARQDGTYGSVPTETATAAINIAHNAGQNMSALYALQAGVAAPFTGLTTQPNDFSLQIAFGGGGASSPRSVAIDSDGNVWGVSNGNIVNWYSSLGAPLSATGLSAGTSGTVNSLLVDYYGNIWTQDSAGKYAEFDSSGNLLSPSGGYAISNAGTSAFTSDASGFLWTTNQSDGSVFRVDPANGTSVSNYIVGSASLIAADSAGFLWVASNAGNLYKFNETANGVTLFLSSFTAGSGSAIATDSQNAAYVADSSKGNITKVDATGVKSSFSDGVGGAQALAVDGANNIFSGGSMVAEHNNSGTLLSGVGFALPAGTVTTSMAVDPSGNLWAAANAENSGQPGAHYIEFLGAASPALAPLSYAAIHGTLQNAQNLIIGFNGKPDQVPFWNQFNAATAAYYQSIGQPSVPGNIRTCHTYISWDVATQAIGSGPVGTEGSRAWFENWLHTVQGHCDRALITFKYIAGITVEDTGSYPPLADYEVAMVTFLNTNWSYTTWTGTLEYTAWNEPNGAGASGDGIVGVQIPAETAADFYLALRKHCQPENGCTVAAGDLASNGNAWQDYVENCSNDLAATLCSGASYIDQYKHWLSYDAANYGFTSSFRPEVFAYHGWDDVNNYINSNSHCTDPQRCTIRAFFNSLSDASWTNAELWDTEIGAGQNPQSNPSTLVQACAASYMLNLTATVSNRFTRLYYTRAQEGDGMYWSLFDSSNNIKPAFTVLADHNIAYVPPAGSNCP